MNVDPQDLERHYASLTDEALLEMNRDDLVEVAQGCFDRELARRGLKAGSETAETGRSWIDDGTGYAVANFTYPDEAAEARDALEAAGIPCYLTQGGANPDREESVAADTQADGAGGNLGRLGNRSRRSNFANPALVVLMVPPAYADRALAELQLEPEADEPLVSEEDQ